MTFTVEVTDWDSPDVIAWESYAHEDATHRINCGLASEDQIGAVLVVEEAQFAAVYPSNRVMLVRCGEATTTIDMTN